jgi:hypothetical protein
LRLTSGAGWSGDRLTTASWRLYSFLALAVSHVEISAVFGQVCIGLVVFQTRIVA